MRWSTFELILTLVASGVTIAVFFSARRAVRRAVELNNSITEKIETFLSTEKHWEDTAMAKLEKANKTIAELKSKAQDRDHAWRNFMIEGDASVWDVCARLNAAAVSFKERMEQAIAERDKWINAEAAATSAHIAMGAELVDAQQQIERLTAELAETKANDRPVIEQGPIATAPLIAELRAELDQAHQHAANRAETIMAQSRERDSLIAGNKALAARNAALERELSGLRSERPVVLEGISENERGSE